MKKDGFTLIELLVTMIVLAIVTAITIPVFARWLPDYRLRAAARDVYSNMQLAKMGAMRNNANWAIVFDTGANRYLVCSDRGTDNSWSATDDNDKEKIVLLTGYESGVRYGHGIATKDATVDEDPIPADNVSYDNNLAVFNPRGTGTGGYVYLENDEGTITYAVGTRTSGVIRLVKWNSSTSEWE
jgi:prepilin-type N-terminal cleavage/methylation domain-containing protein